MDEKRENLDELWAQMRDCNARGDLETGLAQAQAILRLTPDDALALEYAAMFCFNSRRYEEADGYQMRLLAMQPQRADIWLNNAYANRRLEHYALAEERYRLVLSMEPDNYEAWFGVGKTCHFQQNYEGACAALERATALKPDSIEAWQDLVLNRLYVLGAVEAGARDSFSLGDILTRQAVKVPKPAATLKQKLHIGLVSSDLRNHPVGMFAEGLLLSDAARGFLWTAYANSTVFDKQSEKLRPAFEAWHQVKDWCDEKLIGQIREDGIDILIDLNGYTAGHRLGVFAAQAAPVQASWLGYFATTGIPAMQAIIADGYCVPESEEHLYRERVYRMPHTRLCMAPREEDVEVGSLPALERGYITFGCFQNLTKINDRVLHIWGLIAQALPSAHWRFHTGRLKEGTDDQKIFLKKLLDLGFSEERLHFHGASSYRDYLQAHREVDIVLDTFPFPGGTTTVDALWMGVPTLTMVFEGMLSRQGQQLLSAAGLEDWVCFDWNAYLGKAFYWASADHWPQLNELRLGLREKVAASPVFDTETFARDWCALIGQIWHDFTGQDMPQA